MTLQEQVEERVREAFPEADIAVLVDGNRAEINVTSADFAGVSRVKRQQLVYACIDSWIKSGELHAVNIKAVEA